MRRRSRDTSPTERDPEIRRLYLWSFALRGVAGIIGWLLTVTALVPMLQDALFYEEMGRIVAEDWLAGRSSIWLETALNSASGRDAWLMVVFVAVIYWLTGGLRVLPVLIVLYSAITAYTPILVYRIARQLGAPSRTARVGAWLVVLSPAFAFWSGALYKEGLILLFMSLALYHALLLQQKLRPSSLVVIGVCLVALTGLRAYVALSLSGVMIVGMLLGRTSLVERGAAVIVIVRQAVIVTLLVMVLALVGYVGIVERLLPGNSQTIFQQFQASRSDMARYGSGYLRGADVSTPERASAFLPIGVFYFITVPWPWDFGAIRQQLIIPEVAFWLLLYPLLFVGMLRGLQKNFQGSIMLIAMSIALCLFYALIVGNIGTAYRMRIQVWILWAVFFGWGWEWFKEWRAPRRSLRKGRSEPALPQPMAIHRTTDS